jgi:hypothetical protein
MSLGPQVVLAPHVPPLAALFAWIPIGLFVFYRRPARVAVLINFVAGWALLPTANFAPSDSPFPYWILGVCLPAGYFVTKATITGLAGIMGVLLFDRRALRRFRFSAWDLPMIVWCLAPLLSGAANHAAYQGALRGGLRGMAYEILAWGMPYLLGRIYFNDNASLVLAAKAFVNAGLCYVPICIIELYTGPQLYVHVYGYQPYRWQGAERYFGFRPIGFLEDGNQLGIWMAAATLSAAGLWRQGRVRRVLGLPIGWAVIVLFCATILCQSASSIVFLLCLFPLVLISSLSFRRGLVFAFVLVVLCFAGLRLANVISVRQLVDNGGPARAAASFLARIGRQSFGWRLAQDERHVKTALAKPFLGSGQWDWWRNGEGRPWGLWLLAYGMYGGVGLLALEAIQFLPAIGAAWFPAGRDDPLNDDLLAGDSTDSRNDGLRLGLAATILLAAFDNLLNCGMILPLVLVIGGLSVWKTNKRYRESEAFMELS